MLTEHHNELDPATVINISTIVMQGNIYQIYFPRFCISLFILCILIYFFTCDVSDQYFLIVGAFTPLTNEGNIVIDGMLAFCYAFSDHNLAHITVTPMLWFPEMIEWIFGMEKVSQGYVSILADLGGLLLPFNILNM